MKEQLTAFIEKLKADKRIESFDEAATKQAVILRLLSILGWDTFNVEEVKPEYSVSGKSVDYSLRIANANKVFLEVKRIREDLEKHQEQLLNYSFKEGVKLAALTNGITWWFYLPLYEGSWERRRFYTIDILQQDSDEIALRFIDFLSRDNIATKKAIQNAETVYKSRKKQTIIRDTLPKAWDKIISGPDESLIDLLGETTEKICGYKPDFEEIKRFLSKIEKTSLMPLEPQQKYIKKRKITKHIISPEEKITQDDLIPYIIQILGNHGGRVRKKQVDQEIYQLLGNIFNQPWYQEKVSHGVPRWKHNIAWAKERAKNDGLIKSPAESGRGYWELTQKGREYPQQLRDKD